MKKIDELLRKARYFNDVESQFELGRRFLEGDETAADKEEAREWLEKAAHQGHEKAKELLEGLTGEKLAEPAPITPEYSAPIAPLEKPKEPEPEAAAPQLDDPTVAEAVQKEMDRLKAEKEASTEPEPEPPSLPPVEQKEAPKESTAEDCPSCSAKLRKWEGGWRCWACGWPEEKKQSLPEIPTATIDEPRNQPVADKTLGGKPAAKDPITVVPAPVAPEPPKPPKKKAKSKKKKDKSCPDCGDSLRMWEGKWRCWSCGWPDHQSTGHQATYLGGGEKPAGTVKKAWKQQQRQQRVQGKGSGPKDSKKEAKTGCWWILGIIVFISMIKDCDSGGEPDAIEKIMMPDDPYYDEAPSKAPGEYPPDGMEKEKEQPPPNSSLPFRNRNATEPTTSKGGPVGSRQKLVRVSFNQGLRSYRPKPVKSDPKLIAKGKILFQTKICFTCHQADPAVPSPVGLALKAPKFIGDFWGKEREVQLDADPKTPLVFDPGGKTVKIKLNDAYFLESIEKPFAKVLKGSIPGMAPLPTTPEERKALLAYVKSLSKK